MKKHNTARKLLSVILTLAMVFGLSVNAFAAWQPYNGGTTNNGYVAASDVRLEETWVGSKQCINFYKNGQWICNVAGEGNTLWLNSQVIMTTLYNTGYWCFDQWGNCFIIDTAQKLALIRAGSSTVEIHGTMYGCTGFQRNEGKIGYLLYTNNGTYNLADLLNGSTTNNNSYNNNYNSGYNNNVVYSGTPTLTQSGNRYSYAVNGNSYMYELVNDNFYYNSNRISSSVQEIAFANGYVLYVTKSGSKTKLYRLNIGSTSNAKLLGSGFKYFIYDNNGWVTYAQIGTKKVAIGTSSVYDSDDNDNNYDEYPKVKRSKSGTTYTYKYYKKSNNYYTYTKTGKSAYYKGTKSNSASVLISSSVEDCIFVDGYFVYATTSGYVYALPIGKTGTNYRIEIGKKFESFEEDDDRDYFGTGYTTTADKFIDFEDELDIDDDDDDWDDDHDYDFCVEEDDDHYTYYPDSDDDDEYFEYYFDTDDEEVYYKGDEDTSTSKLIASDVEEIVFTEDYLVYALSSGKVYKIEIGKTSSSYREYIGSDFDHFEEEDDYIAFGYVDEDDDYIEF